MPSGRNLPASSGPNEKIWTDNGGLDSIWSLPPFLSEVEAGTLQINHEPIFMESIFEKKSPTSPLEALPSPETDAKPPNSTLPSQRPDTTAGIQRYLIVQSGDLAIAIEAFYVREVTRFPGSEHFDSGPLATTLSIHGKKIIFSALDSLLGISKSSPDRGDPIVIVGDRRREAVLLVDQISGIIDAGPREISERDILHRHQKGWLAQKNKNSERTVIIDLIQILDRVLFEIN